MKRISKRDVEFALSVLNENLQFAKEKSDDLSRQDSDIFYGEYLAYKEAINTIKALFYEEV